MKLFVMKKSLMPEILDDTEESTKKAIEIKSWEEPTKKVIEIKSSEESMEIKSPKEDENTTDWYVKNKLRKNLLLLTATNLITKLK